jgi:hypothetical protein
MRFSALKRRLALATLGLVVVACSGGGNCGDPLSADLLENIDPESAAKLCRSVQESADSSLLLHPTVDAVGFFADLEARARKAGADSFADVAATVERELGAVLDSGDSQTAEDFERSVLRLQIAGLWLQLSCV